MDTFTRCRDCRRIHFHEIPKYSGNLECPCGAEIYAPGSEPDPIPGDLPAFMDTYTDCPECRRRYYHKASKDAEFLILCPCGEHFPRATDTKLIQG